MNDEAASAKGGSGTLRRIHPNSRAQRCPSCDGWVTSRCPCCGGEPDEQVGVELLARIRNAVDAAAYRRTS